MCEAATFTEGFRALKPVDSLIRSAVKSSKLLSLDGWKLVNKTTCSNQSLVCAQDIQYDIACMNRMMYIEVFAGGVHAEAFSEKLLLVMFGRCPLQLTATKLS